jgi:uncharacterized membrane protein
VRNEHFSNVTSNGESHHIAQHATSTGGDNDNDVKNAGDAAWGAGAAAVDKAQEWGARGMAGVNDALGNDSGEAKWEAEANRQNTSAHQNMSGASGQMNNAIDNPNTTSGSTGSGSTWRGDGDNDLKNAGDAAVGTGAAAVDKAEEWGARGMAGLNDAIGNDSGEAKWENVADRENMEARQNMGSASGQFNDAIDNNSGRTNYTTSSTGSEGVVGSSGYTTSSTRESSSEVETDKTEAAAKQGISTTTAADAGAGAVKGAGWGLGIGALAALASLVVPGVGLVVGGGALAAALGGVAAATGAGAAAGAVTGYLKDQGVDHQVAVDYDKTIQSGGALIAVSAPSGDCSREEIMEVLNKYGAGNVNAYEARTSGGGYVA